jgi:hypothetical protein
VDPQYLLLPNPGRPELNEIMERLLTGGLASNLFFLMLAPDHHHFSKPYSQSFSSIGTRRWKTHIYKNLQQLAAEVVVHVYQRAPTLLMLKSFVTAHRSFSRPVALSKALIRDSWPSSILYIMIHNARGK